MAIKVITGKFPHIGWVDLDGKGDILTEVAVLQNGNQGLFFIKLNMIDHIDKQRLFRVINNRNAHLYELWDLMSNITLGNGANALEYFHQYVKVLSESGEVMTPQAGRIAASGFRQAQPGTIQAAPPAAQAAPPAAPAKTTRKKTAAPAE